jgi:ubiquinone/menaquinone biosynthesis C-methylase UbiE
VTGSDAQAKVDHNITAHNRIAGSYESLHGEIFNDIEQARLRSAIEQAKANVATGREPISALDFGCGSGNLTGHLLAVGAHVTAADVSDGFLDLVRSRHPSDRLRTFQLNGSDLDGLTDASFDLVATYSVLHHIPDYLGACAELARVSRPGGVVLIDHEQSEEYWDGDPLYEEFRRAALRFDWRKYLTPANYIHRLRRVFEPRYSNEGDIHVWPDDHIEWTKITEVMQKHGFEIVAEENYLLFRALYRRDVYERFKDRCADTRLMIFRKLGG